MTDDLDVTLPTSLPAESSVSREAGSETASSTRYRVGTLSYTSRGLMVLFAWMLWGDFCFTLMETVVPSILPLKLKSLGATNFTMALIMTTLPGLLNSTICPWVSFKSDRHRSKWGRRIPFILSTAPFLTFFLVLLGLIDPIGQWVHNSVVSRWLEASSTATLIVLVGVFMVGFTFFNMFVGSVYWYLFNDVVPEEYLGRFLGLFRMVGGLAGVLYNYFIFQYAETHMKEIFLGAAILYFFGFGLVCLKVREGEYPPPPKNVDGQIGLLAGVKTFLVECYSFKYYWYLFFIQTFMNMSWSCTATFNVFFAKDIGLNLEQIGQIAAYGGLVGTLLMYPAGMLADRYHPIRIMIGVLLANVLMTPVNLIYLFYNFEPTTVFYLNIAVTMVSLPIGLLYGASELPLYMRIFPKERFGQFCSAMALVRSVGIILGGLIAGSLIDVLKGIYHDSEYCYRFLPVWTWACQILAFISILLLYQGWKKLGGVTHYVPPLLKK
jgi:Na+/melibiose symporter-like transporter